MRVNRNIGKVSDLVPNKNGTVYVVVLDVGSFLGMSGKYVAFPPTDIKTDNNRLKLDRTKEQLQKMAAYELENPDTGAGGTTSPFTGGASVDKRDELTLRGGGSLRPARFVFGWIRKRTAVAQVSIHSPSTL